jgi:hypothetical protein
MNYQQYQLRGSKFLVVTFLSQNQKVINNSNKFTFEVSKNDSRVRQEGSKQPVASWNKKEIKQR